MVTFVNMLQNLADVNKEEIKGFLNSFDHVLCDCDGVIFLIFKPIEGAVNALHKLEGLGKRIGYVSNNSALTIEEFAKRLCSYGVNTTAQNIILPAIAIISYLKSIKFSKKVYIVGLRGMKKEFLDAGFQVADKEPTGDIPETAEDFVKYLKDDLDIGAVVFDYDINMNYIRLQRAMIYAKRADVLFISGACDSDIPVRTNLSVMGPCYFHKALEYMTGRESMKFGKPGKDLNAYVSNHFGLDPHRTLFIGDGFVDMAFANDGGYRKLMVLSGVTKLRDLEECNEPTLLPDYYLNSLADLGKVIEELD